MLHFRRKIKTTLFLTTSGNQINQRKVAETTLIRGLAFSKLCWVWDNFLTQCRDISCQMFAIEQITSPKVFEDVLAVLNIFQATPPVFFIGDTMAFLQLFG